MYIYKCAERAKKKKRLLVAELEHTQHKKKMTNENAVTPYKIHAHVSCSLAYVCARRRHSLAHPRKQANFKSVCKVGR